MSSTSKPWERVKPTVQELRLEIPSSQSVQRSIGARNGSRSSIQIKKDTGEPEGCGSNMGSLIAEGRGYHFAKSTLPAHVKLPCVQVSSSELSKSSSTPKESSSSSGSKTEPEEDVLEHSSSTNPHFEGWIIDAPSKIDFVSPETTLPETVEEEEEEEIEIKKASLDGPDSLTGSEQLLSTKEMSYSHQKESSRKAEKLHGPTWRKPCKASVVAGAPEPFVGNCEGIRAPVRSFKKFFLSQNPRLKHCLVNPDALHVKSFSEKKEFNTLTKTVKYADNLCVDSESQSGESFICEQIDLENPLGLDYQGLDYQMTYEHDENDVNQQRAYRSMVRHLDRRRTKKEIQHEVDTEIHMERLMVPKCFEVEDRNVEVESPPSEAPVPYGKLFRADDKPYNKEKLAQEAQNRRNRYKDLYMQRLARIEREKEQQKEKELAEDELKFASMAKEDFTKVVNHINTTVEKSYEKEHLPQKSEKKRRIYPHTVRETEVFKHEMKEQNRKERYEARIKKQFYLERLGVNKPFPEADVEISSDSTKLGSSDLNLSEQSSDDEDKMQVGRDGDTIWLRGFQYKMGPSLRGLRHQREKLEGARKEKTCMTREQWLAELAPEKETIKVDIEEGITKADDPDDPNTLLFPRQKGGIMPSIKSSAVREYRRKKLGLHYERDIIKKVRTVRPRLPYSVKKFNLIRFLYDEPKPESDTKSQMNMVMEQEQAEVKRTVDYIKEKEKQRRREHEKEKRKRLAFLGIPCNIKKKTRVQKKCEQSDSGSGSDWVPEAEPDIVDEEEENDEVKAAKSVKVPLRTRGNMPAPKFRETTLRRHPRRPRDYDAERVPSQLFDEAVKTTGKPHMLKIMPDKIDFSNTRTVEDRAYAKMFEARHHHDHWNPTQMGDVDVHYQPKVVIPEVTKIEEKEIQEIMENFVTADPPCNAFVEMDLTMVNRDIDEMIENHIRSHKGKGEEKGIRLENICKAKDFRFQTRTEEEKANLDYPGRKEYLEFIQKTREAIYERKKETLFEKEEETFDVDKDQLIKELEEDLKSIDSCLTSLSSSECTNLTNDSGSFLLMEGTTKIPLDYIRKAMVPFKEINRCRFELETINLEKERSNPFKVVPFAGQMHAQKELSVVKDNFFTFNTRLQNGLRLRLEVPVVDIRKELIGEGANKYLLSVATDIDESYIKELRDRPPVKIFNFKSGRSHIKDALRLRFESMLMQGQIIRSKIYDRLNDRNFDNMMRMRVLYEALFAKWEKREYETCMAAVHKVKNYYELTDNLRREFRELDRQVTLLNMDIVFREGQWIRRIMLQNFHYLMGDQEWRIKNDWIHRKKTKPLKEQDEEEGEEEEEGSEEEDEENVLEGYTLSIANRPIVNIRKREKDDAWAIMKYYDEVYMQNPHPKLRVFEDVDGFLEGIENLKNKTFLLLLELHFTLGTHADVDGRLQQFRDWCLADLNAKREYVTRKCAKLVFMQERCQDLQQRTYDFLEEPIQNSYADESFIRHRAVIGEMWRCLVPSNLRSSSGENLDTMQMVAMIAQVVIDILARFEDFKKEQYIHIEERKRFLLKRDRKISREAYQIEKRIEAEMKRVRRNLEPPFVKKRRVGKLPRGHLIKREKKVSIPEKRVSEHTKFFYRAFHDEGDYVELDTARDSIGVMGTIQEQIVPFYFDHFLKLNGYTPNYNFKTNVEIRDGPEMDRCQVRSIVPDCQARLVKWETLKKRVMEDNITRNPKMYENVQF